MKLRVRDEQTGRAILTDRGKREKEKEKREGGKYRQWMQHTHKIYNISSQKKNVYEITKKYSVCSALCKKKKPTKTAPAVLCVQAAHTQL